MKLWHAPPGKLIRGHVLDVAVGPFTQALHELDKQLYVKWNPFKLRGFGCWEIRRKPNRKVAVFKGTFEGADYYNLEYVENNFTCHILDCAFLNYDAIRKLKEMDTWNKDHWIHKIDSAEEEMEQKERDKARAERL